MPRIELGTWRTPHEPAASIGRPLPAIRLGCALSIATNTGWNPFRWAVIDTGAPISLLPPLFWRNSQHITLDRVTIGGVSKRQECRIPAILAEIECTLSDRQHSLGPIRMHAYLAEPEDAPVLIGVLGFIERGLLRVDLSNNRASLRMP